MNFEFSRGCRRSVYIDVSRIEIFIVTKPLVVFTTNWKQVHVPPTQETAAGDDRERRGGKEKCVRMHKQVAIKQDYKVDYGTFKQALSINASHHRTTDVYF